MDTLNKLLTSLPSPAALTKNLPTTPWSSTTNQLDEDEIEESGPYDQYTDDPTAAPMSLTDPAPISSGPKGFLDLINECDNFPYYHVDRDLYLAHVNTYYTLHVVEYPEIELGYVLPSVAAVFQGLPDWEVDNQARKLTLLTGNTEAERSRIVASTCSAMRATEHFAILKGWRDELYPVYGPEPKREVLFTVERAASALFGIVTYGVHMTAYTYKASESGEGSRKMKIWVPRRAKSKQTYGGMLDNTVAGGIAAGEEVFECMVRESQEEASLPEEVVRNNAKAVGTVTYFHIRDSRAGGETRLLQPECQFVYDLELEESVVPKPSDDEVEAFELISVEEVREALKNGEFKPNCALVLIDFFVRHGIVGPEEEGYVEIVSRLHRRLEFPTL